MTMEEDEETQLQEIEVLESIFGAEEFKVLSKGYPKISLAVEIGTELSTTLAQVNKKRKPLTFFITFFKFNFNRISVNFSTLNFA